MTVHSTAGHGPPPHSWALSWRRAVPAPVRDRLHNALVDTPGVGAAYVRLRPQLRHARLTTHTDLVLDGFPRSANAYAEFAFRYANPDTEDLAVRLHSARGVRAGVRRGLPTIVLIRPPRDAVASWLQYKRGLDATETFRRYVDYYQQLMPVREDVVIAAFDEVVSDFGAVIKRCNDRFDTEFDPYTGGPAAEAWVRSQIESAWSYDETGELPEHMVPRPSESREQSSDVLDPLETDPRVRAEISAAQTTWHQFLTGLV